MQNNNSLSIYFSQNEACAEGSKSLSYFVSPIVYWPSFNIKTWHGIIPTVRYTILIGSGTCHNCQQDTQIEVIYLGQLEVVMNYYIIENVMDSA